MSYEAEFNFDEFLELRRHLKVAHHIPGRIRLKAGLSILDSYQKVDAGLIDRILGAIQGIKTTEFNLMARSVVIAYVPSTLKPEWWDCLIAGSEEEAVALLSDLLNTNLAPAVEAARNS